MTTHYKFAVIMRPMWTFSTPSIEH